MDEFEELDDYNDYNDFDYYDDYRDLDEELGENKYIDDGLSSKLSEIIRISKLITRTYKDIIYNEDNVTYLNHLKVLVNIENHLYDKLNLDIYNEITILSILRELENIYCKSLHNVFGAVCNDNIENMWLYRIDNKLSSIKAKQLTSLVGGIYNNDLSVLEYGLESIQYNEIEKALGNDFLRAYIFFLNEEIERCEDSILKHDLIETKYKLICTKNVLEEDLIFSKNNEDKFIYMTYGYVSDLVRSPKEFTDRIQKEVGFSYVDYALGNLELLHEVESGNDFLKTVFSLYFRAGLTLLYNNENYELFKEDIQLDVFGYDDIDIFSKVNLYLEETNNDIGKCKYLSLINPNNY